MEDRHSRRLILASGSRYKRELLERLGLRFESANADIDERRRAGEAPPALAARLAREKAAAIAADRPDAWVIGADQVIALEDDVLSKSGGFDRALEQLQRLQGRRHALISAVAVVAPTGTYEASAPFEMWMRPWSTDALAEYLREDEPYDCAGSYKLEEGGIRLFERMVGDDYTSIVGLPLTVVWSLLESSGYFEA